MKLRVRAWMPALMAVVFALLVTPVTALAREYSIAAVDIDATVTEDGVLRVSETRTFDFDGSFNGVYWKIPTGENSNNGKNVELTVDAVGEGSAESMQEFTLDDTGGRSTYELTDYGDYTQVKLYSPHEDQAARFTIVYELTNVATRWSDTGEIYWKFVSDGWDVESQHVTCTLHLPVAGGESVTAGENVRAWGHGPLDASVTFEGNDIVYKVPGVGTDEYAEMRVTFPAAWLAGCEQTAGDKLQGILSEEKQWADEANAERARVRTERNVATFGPIGLAVVSLVVAVAARVRYSRDHAPKFQDKYFRDVPTKDHPAVLGVLYNGGKAEPKELTATLMRLTDGGVIKLERATLKKKGFLKSEKTTTDYLVTKLKDVPKQEGREKDWGRSIDQGACRLLFSDVAGASNKPGSQVYLSAFKKEAESDPEAYEAAWNAWTGVAEARYENCYVSDAPSPRGRALSIGLGVVDILFAIGLCIYLFFRQDDLLLTLGPTAILLSAGIAAATIGAGMKPLSREGIEAKAQLEALRCWLKEFTKLDEAVPEDVVLWNRLLVMAVVLGVSKEVIRQLEVALPQVLEDPYFMPCYGWCYYGNRYDGLAPSDVFTKGFASAHEVSSAALAASSDSSGSGGGGGFSSGGGGGFGGGGGGGAF